MPHRPQTGSAGLTFHVMNRGVRRMQLFDDVDDYLTLVGCLAEALELAPVALFAFCVMPNHFHLIVRPAEDLALTRFMRLMTIRHSKRWHRRRKSKGGGAVYQGRFRAFPIQTEHYFYAACRYVEANPLRANLVGHAQDWPWSSLRCREEGFDTPRLEPWPVLRPDHWIDLVNDPQNQREVCALRRCAHSNLPFGAEAWSHAMASLFGTTRGLRRPGPRSQPKHRELIR